MCSKLYKGGLSPSVRPYTTKDPTKENGAFHLPAILGNFGRQSSRKFRFGSVRPEYLEPPLEVVHYFDRSERKLQFQHRTKIVGLALIVTGCWHYIFFLTRKTEKLNNPGNR